MTKRCEQCYHDLGGGEKLRGEVYCAACRESRYLAEEREKAETENAYRLSQLDNCESLDELKEWLRDQIIEGELK